MKTTKMTNGLKERAIYAFVQDSRKTLYLHLLFYPGYLVAFVAAS